jgi:hypothetical protein
MRRHGSIGAFLSFARHRAIYSAWQHGMLTRPAGYGQEQSLVTLKENRAWILMGRHR